MRGLPAELWRVFGAKASRWLFLHFHNEVIYVILVPLLPHVSCLVQGVMTSCVLAKEKRVWGTVLGLILNGTHRKVKTTAPSRSHCVSCHLDEVQPSIIAHVADVMSFAVLRPFTYISSWQARYSMDAVQFSLLLRNRSNGHQVNPRTQGPKQLFPYTVRPGDKNVQPNQETGRIKKRVLACGSRSRLRSNAGFFPVPSPSPFIPFSMVVEVPINVTREGVAAVAM
ncbi:hypothetical protein EV126DRAFT_16411 [Verticillium dahliae]|nr:hypothetical protein EV126DRAFT_16411 [Verticillium dahliae]